MKNMNGFRRWAPALLLCGIAVLPVQARPGDDGPDDKPGAARLEKRMDGVLEQLNLSEDQKKKLQEHRRAKREAMRAHFESVREKREAIRGELEKADFDEAKVKALHAEIKALQNQTADDRLNGILEVRKILTADQFKKFSELTREKRDNRKKEWKEKRGEGRKRGRPGPESGERP